MIENGTDGERLDSWKSICAYLERDVSTLLRWEKEKGLPIHRIPGGHRQAVYAFRRELEAWLAGVGHTNGAEQTPVNGNGQTEPTSESAGPMPVEIANPLQGTIFRMRRVLYSGVGLLAALLLLITVYLYKNSHRSFHAPQLIEQQQLTTNDEEKDGLLTDGKTLYFGQEQDGWFALAAMLVDGGPIRVLWSPKANVLPADISPDGRKLLALASLGMQQDSELWVVPLDGGEPRRLAKITAHSAVWSPDGKTIAYASGFGIYLTSEGETASIKIGSFAGYPNALSWSQDGQRLCFILRDSATLEATSWGQISGDGMETTTLNSLPPTIKADGYWNQAVGQDARFATGPVPKAGSTQFWLVQYGSRWWKPVLQVVPMGLVPGNIHGIATSRESSRVFVLSELLTRAAFIRFDPRTQAFRGILPGVSGKFLDYSRDGKWVTYTSYGDGPLWVSRADGSAARQITFSPEKVELPRWSPDGKQIAYMAQQPGRPWRIYILQLDSGATREASEGDDSQGAPTWSPDGRFLAYGNVECEHANSCAIHRVDLATGKVQTLPDSDGLFTARWSPAGRYIAARNLQQHRLMLFNVKVGKWHTLAGSIDSPDLSWSADSKYLYASVHGTEARIIRIRIGDEHQETVLDLRSQDKFDITTDDDLQFSVAPDNSVIMHRRIRPEEIYAYDLRDR